MHRPRGRTARSGTLRARAVRTVGTVLVVLILGSVAAPVASAWFATGLEPAPQAGGETAGAAGAPGDDAATTSEDAPSETADTAGDPGEDSEGPTQGVADRDGEGGLPIWAWILVGVGVVAALLGALVGGTRRSDEERDLGA